jgi:branched-chain amino acid transport system substrate-binding protein
MTQCNRRFFLKSFALTGLGLSSVSLFSGCATKKKTAFKIGFLTPKTGVDAESGTSCERAARIGKSFLKFLGVDLEIIVSDTESNAEVARLKAEKLINDGVHCLIGAYNSAATATIAQVAEQHKVPFIVNLSAADTLTEQGYQYLFRNFPTSKMLADNSISGIKTLFAENNFAPKTGTLIVLNDAYGQTMLDAFQIAESQQRMPFNLEKIIQFDTKAKDLSTEVAKIKSINSDVLLIVSRINSTNLIMKELIRQNHNPKAIISPGGQGFYEGQFLKNFKEKADNLYTVNAWFDPVSSLTKRAISVFNKYYPEKLFEMNVAFSLEAIYLATMAYKQAQSNKAEKLCEALRNISLSEGIIYGGNIEFNEKGQRTNIRSVSLMNQDGMPRVVSPKGLHETQAIFPFPGF